MDQAGLLHYPPLGIAGLLTFDVELGDLLPELNLIPCFALINVLTLRNLACVRAELNAFESRGSIDVSTLQL